MGRKLYVGNLSFAATEDELREYFGQAGTPETVAIIKDRLTGKSRGFGFVEMSEGGDAAITALNGTEFRGRNLTVNEAKPREERPRSGGGGYNRPRSGGGGGRW